MSNSAGHCYQFMLTGLVMSLKFEIDSLEGVDESLHGMYKQYNGKYRLQVDGIDDAAELKEALRKEREERAAAKTKLSEFEKQQQEVEQKRLEEKQEFEKLWKSEQEQRNSVTKELEELRGKIALKDRSSEAQRVAASLATETARAELLQKEAMGFIHHTPEGIKINGPGGEAWDAKQLGAYLKEKYPFLVDGSKASGGGAVGASGSGATGKKFNELTGAQLKELKDTDPTAYERLKSEFYNR